MDFSIGLGTLGGTTLPSRDGAEREGNGKEGKDKKESAAKQCMKYVKPYFGWAGDQLVDSSAIAAGTLTELGATATDMLGGGLGNPQLGSDLGFHDSASGYFDLMSPFARAGWYDPNSWGAVALGIGSMFVNPGAAPTKVYSLYTYIPTVGRKFNQLAQRGWTRQMIQDTVNNPYTTRASVNKATGNAATAYYQQNGAHIVRDNVTGELVQMSPADAAKLKEWTPDSEIVNPYVPCK
jgi:hypothetical protein